MNALNKHFEQLGIDNDILWSKIYDYRKRKILNPNLQKNIKDPNIKNLEKSISDKVGLNVLIKNNKTNNQQRIRISR